TGQMQLHRQAFIDDQDLYATLPWDYLSRIEEELPGIDAAPRLYAAGLASAGDASNGVMIKAVDPLREREVTKMLDHLRLGESRLDLASGADEALQRYNVIVGAQLAKNMRLAIGDELVLITQAADGSIGNALFRVAGVLRPVEPNFDRMGVLMSIEAYQYLMYLEEGFHELALKSRDLTDLEATQQAIATLLRGLALEQPLDELGGAARVRNWRELAPAIADLLELSRSMVLIVGFIIVGLASLGMLNTMLMAVHERSHEFGILLSIGMSRWWLLTMVMFESLCLALISALAGSLVGALAAGYFERHGLDFSASMPDGYDWAGMVFEPVMYGYLLPQDLLRSSLLMIAIALLASIIPSWRTIRLKPAQVLR
ncbi:MAG: FtsX-like permease family protein, partial [Gammaproteobacteria bacterium]|nr:FtsX-like permease family protein [Gammaproteobacteria bacterium]